MTQCRWCGMVHGPLCPVVKAIEYQSDGITVKRVEFKTAADYGQQVNIPSVWPHQWPQAPTHVRG